MNIKIVDENIDHITGKKYYLGRVNVKDISEYIKAANKDVDFDKFNNDSIEKVTPKTYTDEELHKLHKDNINEYSGLLSLKKISFEDFKKSTLHYDEKRFNWDTDKLLKNENTQQMIFNTATENNFISIWGDFEQENNHIILNQDLYLLDGFRRLLFDFKYLEKDTNKDIYIKIYDQETNDQDIMNMMLHLNLWKLPQGIDAWLDRGWRFFLFKKLDIYLASFHFRVLDYYLSNDYLDLQKVITDKNFYYDLKELDKIEKTRKFEDISKHYHTRDFSYIVTLARKLGKMRLDKVENFFDTDSFNKFLRINVNEIRRISLMEVYGHYIKPIEALIDNYIDVIKDEQLFKALMSADESKIVITDLNIFEYYEQLPKSVIEEFEITKPTYKKHLSIKNRIFSYKNSKLYHGVGGVSDLVDLRVYFIFGDYFIFKYQKGYVVHPIKDSIEYGKLSTLHGEYKYYSMKEILVKVKKLTGKEYLKLPAKETIFIGDVKK